MAETRCPVCLGQKQIVKMGLMGHIDCTRCNKKGVVQIEVAKVDQSRAEESFIEFLNETKEDGEYVPPKETEQKEPEEKPKKQKSKKSFLKKGS